VRINRLGGNPEPRAIPFWISSAAAAVLTISVLVALATLHSWSDQQQVASQAISTLRADAAVEQEGVTDPSSNTRHEQRAVSADLAAVHAAEGSSPAWFAIDRLAQAYESAVILERAELASGDVAAADAANKNLGDPAFTLLDAELAAVTHEEAASASSGVAIAFVASSGIVFGSGLLIFLFALFARRRRARIADVEAAASALAQEARITATREETFRALFDENPQAMLVTRLPAGTTASGNLQFLSVNNAAMEMYGYSRAAFLALTLAAIRPAEDRDQLINNLQAMRSGRTHFEGIRHCTSDGRILDVEIDTRETMFDGETAMIVCPNDVTDRVRLQRELEHQAFHDALTGLPNRSLFADRLRQAHERRQRVGGFYAVLMLDLDNFKTVNDSLGHAAGDELLGEVSRRLSGAIRPGDTAARLGGDEFEILLEDLAEPSDASLAAEALRAALRTPFSIGGHQLTITATIGVATSSGGGAATDVIRNADVALYVGKADGKDRHAMFSEHMYAAAVERLALEQDLRAGIGRDELILLYQPKVDARSGTMSGVEALIRWVHPKRGLIGPDVFIPIAEQTGLINDIDTWVLTTACRQAQRWAASDVGPIPVAVNVSGRSMVSCHLLERVLQALDKTGLDPCLLELEITESAAIPQQGDAPDLLQKIRDLGVRIAIDDFGTGYSVLSRLQGFPVDTLKIDLSFTRTIVSEYVGVPIIDAMIAMGLGLGLKVVAEGVETEVQRAYLASKHCTELQGYLFSRPIGPDELVAKFRPNAAVAAGPVTARRG
jgi:diguanylate cyclase (GGDEF)-like protein/PAS domain S-box-containing protein